MLMSNLTNNIIVFQLCNSIPLIPSFLCHFFFKLETWILYRGREKGVSKFVREAYQNYGDMEFGNNNKKISYSNKESEKKKAVDINNINRHIKLIGIAREEVCSVGL